MKLTENQKDFLLEFFFKNEEFVGWKNVAAKLLETGSCIVAGKKCIWSGGIGNFIQVDTAEEAIDCLKYTFDLKYFLTSEYFKQTHVYYLANLLKELDKIEKKYNELDNL